MPKKQWEIDARDRFLKFLHEVERQDYEPSAEDVVTNPLTGRDYDFELAPRSQGPPIIAFEIFRLVGDETDLAHHYAWNDIVRRMQVELNSRGIAGHWFCADGGSHSWLPRSRSPAGANDASAIRSVRGSHCGAPPTDADRLLLVRV